MTQPYSLFIISSACKEKGTLLCTGIVVPISQGISTTVKLDYPVTAFVNGDRRFTTMWKPLGALLSPSYIDDEERVRMVATSRFYYEIVGAIETITPPCFLTPDSQCQPIVLDASVELLISTLFETADFQSHLWLQTTGPLVAPFVFGETGMDQSMLRHSRHLCPSTGDAFHCVVNGKQERGGVVLLQRQIDGNKFAASLRFPVSDVSVLCGSTLISRRACEIESMTGIFQVSLARIL